MSEPTRKASERASGDGAASPFSEMARTPANHFVLHFHATVYALIGFVRAVREQAGDDAAEVVDAYPFLSQYLAEDRRFMPENLTWADGVSWWWTALSRWEKRTDQHLPIRALSTERNMTMTQRLAFSLAGLLEEDSRFGTLFADLQSPVSSRRPTVELIGRVVQHVDPDVDGWAVCRPLLDNGLVRVVDRNRPRSEWALRVPFLLWEAARGDVPASLDGSPGRTRVRPAEQIATSDEVILSDEVRERIRNVPSLMQAGNTRFVVVRGTAGSDRIAALEAIARDLNRGIVHVDVSNERSGQAASDVISGELGPFCVLARLMPVFSFELPPGESRSLPSISGYEGPVGVSLGKTGGLTGDALSSSVTLSLGSLSADERRRHWRAAFDGMDVENLDVIVDRFQLPGRYLRRAGASAVRRARLEGRETVTVTDVRHATRSLERQSLDTLAERVDVHGTWEHLVVNPTAEEKLRDLERRCHHRERILSYLGPAFGSQTTKGVRALFAGPSGTGKTLAARILASELGMDLYRVDLAAVIDKYVGETEKNLHRVLSTAEELDIILLLDEGDALLGRRTEVSTANDRYANVETNYLLQRLEHYSGIVLVTSNLADNIDPAFQRRMDMVVDFSRPSPDERLAIWSMHLPTHHAVSDALLEEIARECSFTGGQIRNAALKATLIALDATTSEAPTNGAAPGNGQLGNPPSESTVADDDLIAAVRDEYRKSGAICPLTTTRSSDSNPGVEQFVDGFRT